MKNNSWLILADHPNWRVTPTEAGQLKLCHQIENDQQDNEMTMTVGCELDLMQRSRSWLSVTELSL